MASASFRRDSEAHGLAKAIWIAVFKDYSEKLGILSPIQGSGGQSTKTTREAWPE